MELRKKKRLIGLVVLLGVALVQLPFLLHNKKPADQAAISLDIPNPPAAPKITSAMVSALPEDATPQSTKVVSKPVAAVSSPVSHSSRVKPVVKAKSKTAVAKKTTAKPAVVAVKKQLSSKKSTSKKLASKPMPAQSTKMSQSDAGTEAWSIQLGYFSEPKYADSLLKKLRAKGYESYMRTVQCRVEECKVVYVGPEIRWSKVKKLQASVYKDFHLKGIIKNYQL